jgi:hypothetical protein
MAKCAALDELMMIVESVGPDYERRSSTGERVTGYASTQAHRFVGLLAKTGGRWFLWPVTATTLDALMAPVTDCLDAKALHSLSELRASPEASERMEWLAGRANEGSLTAAERAEYESCIQFANFLGVLQSKARKKIGARR